MRGWLRKFYIGIGIIWALVAMEFIVIRIASDRVSPVTPGLSSTVNDAQASATPLTGFFVPSPVPVVSPTAVAAPAIQVSPETR